MIGYLRGLARSGSVVVDASGVGWKINCPSPPLEGTQVELLVTCLVKEDSITLYGFTDSSQQRCFDALRAVSGVGPATALAILRDLGVNELIAALTRNDPRPLQAVKGVGARNAQRIVAMTQLPADLQSDDDRPADDLQRALEAMGFPAVDAARALAHARSEPHVSEQEILTAALAMLRAAA